MRSCINGEAVVTYPGKAKAGKDDECSPVDVLNGDGCNLNYDNYTEWMISRTKNRRVSTQLKLLTDTHPVHEPSKRLGTGADPCRADFAGVEPNYKNTDD